MCNPVHGMYQARYLVQVDIRGESYIFVPETGNFVIQSQVHDALYIVKGDDHGLDRVVKHAAIGLIDGRWWDPKELGTGMNQRDIHMYMSTLRRSSVQYCTETKSSSKCRD